MNDRDDVADAVTTLLHAIDVLDWQRIETAFVDELRVDYSSLFGGEPETMSAGELLDRWRGLLPGFDATQHLTGPVLVSVGDDTSATAHTHVRGYHYIADAPGGSVWQVAGHYVMTLTRPADSWKITSLTLELFYQDGNLDLPALATDRAPRGQR